MNYYDYLDWDNMEMEDAFLTKEEKHIIKKGIMVLLFPFFLVYLGFKIVFLVAKKILWNKITKWIYRKILYFPVKFLRFLGFEIVAFASWFN